MTKTDFRNHLKNVRKSGDGWLALCPAHEDRANSLSVTERDGKILVHCHAGCSPRSIVESLGLRLSDLYINSRCNENRRIVTTYDYKDESSSLLYQTVRKEPGRDGKKKEFFQRRPDGRGGWINDLKGVRRVLYRLPELLASNSEETIWIPEGEKDVETLRALGLVATCNVCGAGKWRSEYSQYLRGRKVVIIPDNDEAGRKHAEDVAKHLRGIAR